MGQEQDLKWTIQDKLRKVPMKAPAKTVMWDLLSRADAKTGIIPARHTPSLDDLADSTCQGRSTVARYMNGLEATGWLVRERPTVADALNHGRRTQYRLAVGSFDLPPGLKHEKQKRKPKKDESTFDSPGAGLSKGVETGQDSPAAGLSEPTESGQDTPGAGPSESNDSPGAGPSVVPERDLDSPGAGHNIEPPTGVLSSSVHQSSSPPTGGDAPAPQPEDGALFDDEQIERKPKPETDNQRANRLTKVYYDRVPMSKFVATSQIVKKAIGSKYTDDQITAGLNALADDPGRPVTLNTLRIAIEGGPKHSRNAPGGDWRDVSGQDHSGWTKRADNRTVSTPEAIATGWTRKGTTQ